MIGQVRTIERNDPVRVKQVVEELKARGVKGNARARRDREERSEARHKEGSQVIPEWSARSVDAAEDRTASARDLSHQAPDSVSVFPAPPICSKPSK
ncbi:MAG TPA: hypothetical protein VHA82_09475 [Ramlibacter sp.]|uniref:hypothetical protein n=1 Tax=Ramlibacter sp. TaxID=1917967 RepID=UPI002D079DE8|nr:hypothetical protein [Ramlibacter sp.]HVZ44029.1 hypothetical protein [Ramlibacter sp.]